jgi:GT2 family glycosyltransferase
MTSEETEILIIIPMYGEGDYTKKCIDFCIKHAGIVHDILVVDDGSPEPFEDNRVEILRIEKNGGYTPSVNQGILYAQKLMYKYVLLLNNDTEPEQDFLKLLVEEAELKEENGVICPARLYPNGEVELHGADLVRGYQHTTKRETLPKDSFECVWIPFACVLLKMSMIREIGLLDKDMKMYCTDNEYCLRARFAGYKTVLVPQSMVFHHHSVTCLKHNILPEEDQRKWIEKISGYQYAKVMQEMPLDAEKKTYGMLSFDVVTR